MGMSSMGVPPRRATPSRRGAPGAWRLLTALTALALASCSWITSFDSFDTSTDELPPEGAEMDDAGALGAADGATDPGATFEAGDARTEAGANAATDAGDAGEEASDAGEEATTTCGEFGDCLVPAGDACVQVGVRVRTCTDRICPSGSCEESTRTESEACRRPTEGEPCGGGTTCGDYGSCDFVGETLCARARSRECIDRACQSGSCAAATRVEREECPYGVVCEGILRVDFSNEDSGFDALVAEGCEHFIGRLTFEGHSPTLESTATTGLEPLTCVDGPLNITDRRPVPASALPDLAGLKRIGSVNCDGSYLRNLEELRSVEHVSGNLAFVQCDIDSLSGLRSLVSIGGDLELNSIFDSLAGLERLASIGGSLLTRHQDYSDVKLLEGLEALTRIEGSIELVDENLLSVSGLRNLQHVGGSFRLENSEVTSLAPLLATPPETLMGELSINDNASLSQCEAERLAAHWGKTCNCSGNAGTGTCAP